MRTKHSARLGVNRLDKPDPVKYLRELAADVTDGDELVRIARTILELEIERDRLRTFVDDVLDLTNKSRDDFTVLDSLDNLVEEVALVLGVANWVVKGEKAELVSVWKIRVGGAS